MGGRKGFVGFFIAFFEMKKFKDSQTINWYRGETFCFIFIYFFFSFSRSDSIPPPPFKDSVFVVLYPHHSFFFFFSF